jgi:undecaprenyl-diphosphatase
MNATLQRLAPYRSLLTGLAAASLASAFIALGGEMLEGETHAFDTAILRAAQALRLAHPWVADAMRDLSGLGSPTVLTLVTALTVGYLTVMRAHRRAVLLAASVITGALSVSLLKAQFGRPRPSAEFAELVAPGLSFPSGHASMSAIVFLSVATLLASTRTRTAEQGYILATAALLTVLVGASRIALGVHWATDVVGGWAFGTAWALAWLLVARWLARAHPGSNAERSG